MAWYETKIDRNRRRVVTTWGARVTDDALMEYQMSVWSDPELCGFDELIDYRALGLGLVAVTRIKARGEALPNIVRSLIEHPHLTHVYEITGEFDVMVIGRFQDEAEMNREIKSMLSLPGIEGTNTSVVLDAPKEQLDVELPLA